MLVTLARQSTRWYLQAVGDSSSAVLLQDAYQAYEQHFKDSPPAVLRDCLELKSGLDPISIDEVCNLCLSVLSACTPPHA